MRIVELMSQLDSLENVNEITTLVVNNFDSYPNIQSGFKSFISDLDTRDIETFRQQIVNLLSVINNFTENEFDALNLALESVGPWYFEDTVETVNRGDFIYFPEVESDYDLGVAYVDMIGSIADAVGKDRLDLYINVRDVAEAMYRDDEDYAQENNLDVEDFEEIAGEEIAANPEQFAEEYFDYEAFGRDLRIGDGYYIGNTGAIWIL